MTITFRGLAIFLFLLVMCGFPFVSIFGAIVPAAGGNASIGFRLMVLALCIIVFASSFSKVRMPTGYVFLLLFMTMYLARLLVDLGELGSALVLRNLIFFSFVVFVPTVALATRGYSPADDKYVAKWIVYFTVIQCSYLFAVWLAGEGYNAWADVGAETDRFALERLNPISVGHAAMTGIVAASVLIVDPTSRRGTKIVCVLTTILAAAVFLSANSRGPAVAGGAAILWLVAKNSKRKIRFVFVVLIAFCIAEYFAGMVSSLIDRFDWDTVNNQSNNERITSQSKAIAFFLANPIFGAFSIDPNAVEGEYPHNLFLETAQALGVSGLILIVPLVLYAFVRIVGNVGEESPLLAALFIQKFLALQMSGTIALSDSFFVVLALILVSKKRFPVQSQMRSSIVLQHRNAT